MKRTIPDRVTLNKRSEARRSLREALRTRVGNAGDAESKVALRQLTRSQLLYGGVPPRSEAWGAVRCRGASRP